MDLQKFKKIARERRHNENTCQLVNMKTEFTSTKLVKVVLKLISFPCIREAVRENFVRNITKVEQ